MRVRAWVRRGIVTSVFLGALLFLLAWGGPATTHLAGPWVGPAPGLTRSLAPAASPGPTLVWREMTNSASSGFTGCSAVAYDDVIRTPICVNQIGGGAYTSVWTFSGSTWTNITPAGPRPEGRALGPLAPDGENLLVLYPVIGGNGKVDTWGFTGAGWTNLSTNGTPPAWVDPTMAYDPIDGYTVLFGGASGACSGPGHCQPENSTWILLGANWTNATTTAGPAPSPRVGAGFVSDPLRDRLVLFGGSPDGYSGTNDAWKFFNGNWSKLSLPGSPVPPPRESECSGFDTTLGSIVVANGANSGTGLTDTWLLNSTGWSQDTTAGTLSATCSPYTTVFDVRDNYLLTLASAEGLTGAPANETWVLAPPVPPPSTGLSPWLAGVIIGIPAAGIVGLVLAVVYVRTRARRPSGPPAA